MKNKSIIWILILIFLVSSFIPIISSYKITSNNIIYVDDDGGADYTRIQDAIDNANNGDMIFIYSGLYHENIIINKSINLIGENQNITILDGENREKYTLHIDSSSVVIEDLRFQNGSDDCWQTAIWIHPQAVNSIGYITISNCTFSDCNKGITASNVFDSLIRGCNLYNSTDRSITGNFFGNLTVRDCIFTNNGKILGNEVYRSGGVRVDASSTKNHDLNCKIYSCYFSNIIYLGIQLSGQSINGEIFSNNLYNVTHWGINLYQNSNFNVHHNIISGCKVSSIDARFTETLGSKRVHDNNIFFNDSEEIGHSGINLLKAKYVNIENNTIFSNLQDCIRVQVSSENIITHNIITGNNKHGINCYNSSNDNIFASNYVEKSQFYNIGVLADSNNNAVYDNVLTEAGTDAIYVVDSNNNIIESNNIYNNSNGVGLVISRNNSILSNNLINNTPNAYVTHSLDTFLFADNKFIGNYWSDYPGIGPKKIDGLIGLRIPLLNKYIVLDYPKFDLNPAKEPYDI